MYHIKAVFWRCDMHTECPLSAAEILRFMPIDDEVEGLFATVSGERFRDGRRGPGRPGHGRLGLRLRVSAKVTRVAAAGPPAS